jgi:hypothetical protein
MEEDFVAVIVRIVGHFGRIGKPGNHGKREGIRELQNFADGREIVPKIIDDYGETRGALGQSRWMRRACGDVRKDMDDVSALVVAGVFEANAAAVGGSL